MLSLISLICFFLPGKHLAMLPVEPKLGKMLIFGAIFNCLDPILTIVAGLSVRDPFLTPFDKKEVRNCFSFFPFVKILARNVQL
jgi:HrpA-like RNA helicase